MGFAWPTRSTAAAGRRRAPLARWLDSPPPRVAVEIGGDAVLAARVRPGERGAPRLAQTALAPLPAGAVAAAAAEPNVRDAAALTAALRQALERVGGMGREVVLLLPDLAARVMVLEFEEIPRRAEDLAALVRFRLRKTLPFDPESAVLAAEVVEGGGERAVLAVVAARARVEEYEAALEAAGARAALLLRHEGGALTSAFAWEEAPRLFRVLPAAPALAYEDLYPSAAYFRDFYEGRGEAAGSRPRIAGFGVPAELLERLRRDCDWAEVAAAPAWPGSLLAEAEDGERFLAVAGALAEGGQ